MPHPVQQTEKQPKATLSKYLKIVYTHDRLNYASARGHNQKHILYKHHSFCYNFLTNDVTTLKIAQ